MILSLNIWNPTKVKNIFVFCGTNDVVNVLSIPRHFQSEIVQKGNYWSSENLINRVKVDFTKLVDFLHNWSCNAHVVMWMYLTFCIEKVLSEMRLLTS